MSQLTDYQLGKLAAMSLLGETAHDEIYRLRAENQRLREALEAAPQPNNDNWIRACKRPNRTTWEAVNRQYCQWYAGNRAEALKGGKP